MKLLLSLVIALTAIFSMAVAEENAVCGQVDKTNTGPIPEWPNLPVDFQCKHGFSQLALCILNREGVEALPNSGEHFLAVDDGDAVYAMTRDTHPAYPMIVKRKPTEIDGVISIQTLACGYGDKTASDTLMAQYQAMDEQLKEDMAK